MKCWFSKEKRGEKYENKLLSKWGNLDASEYEIKDIFIGPTQEDYIHTITLGKISAPIMIFLPGFGTACSICYKLLKELSKTYRVYCIDLRGMGLSGRPKYEGMDLPAAEEFFIEGIEKSIEELITPNEKFTLTGHSLGGYVSIIYALKYPERIHKLFLCSPAGLDGKPLDYSFDELVEKQPWYVKLGAKLVLPKWKEGETPIDLLRNMKIISPFLMGLYVKKSYTGLSTAEKRDLRKYLREILLRVPSGEYAMPFLLEPGAWAKSPLEYRISNLDIPIVFIYGDKDWMPSNAAIRLCASDKVHAVYYIVENAGHNMLLDNPPQMINIIMKTANPENLSPEKYIEEEKMIN